MAGEEDVERAADWVRRHDFQRVAVQIPDSLLQGAVRTAASLQTRLPGRKVFLLGDSAYGNSAVDEVGADHYGADCLIHVGSSDQEHTGTMPVLFLFGGTAAAAAGQLVEHAVAALSKAVQSPPLVALVGDAGFEGRVAVLATALASAPAAAGGLLVAEPQREGGGGCDGGGGGDSAACGSHGSGAVGARGAATAWRDFRFGALPLAAAWWASVGPLGLAAAARPEPLRICGRRCRTVPDRAAEASAGEPPLRMLPTGSALLYVGDAGSALERRLLLRYGNAHQVFRMESSSGDLTLLSSDALLMKRYRFVELARSAEIVGLLMSATGSASAAAAVADRLEALLRSAGRRVCRFVVGRVTPEKLGNFPEVDCFVSLASPDHFPFDVRDFHVPIASPYEMEVALKAREWSGCYVTDLEELLLDPLPNVSPSEDALFVQTLGASARVRSFGAGRGSSTAGGVVMDPAVACGNAAMAEAGWAPARVAPGLHGVAGRYATEVG